VTPLEEAATRNLELRDQLAWQLGKLSEIGQWSDLHSAVFSLEITQQRLEQLISYMFDPQEEVSREAFELAWEDALSEKLELALQSARSILFLPTTED